MHNPDVKRALKDCMGELVDIQKILLPTNIRLNKITKYLTNYSIIKACGTIEYAYKCLIADYFGEAQSEYIKNFLSKRIRDSSANPDMSIIYGMLNSFDKNIEKRFKDLLKQELNRNILVSSLNSLRTERNTLAHGGSSIIPFSDVLKYFKDSRRIIQILDNSLYFSSTTDIAVFFVKISSL